MKTLQASCSSRTTLLAVLFGLLLLMCATPAAAQFTGPAAAQSAEEHIPTEQPHATLPGISGLSWLEGDQFIAVHDVKASQDSSGPRVSLIRLPEASGGMQWTPLTVTWPAAHGPANDLESIARIPGTSTFLIAESGSGGDHYQHLFLADFSGESFTVRQARRWPLPVQNIEGVSLACVGPNLLLLFAERAAGQTRTTLRWASFDADSLAFGAWNEAPLSIPLNWGPPMRPISALHTDSSGRVYAATAFDPDDDGPFRSVIWQIGRFEVRGKRPRFTPLREPKRLATLDGFKVEGLTFREANDGGELFIGTDGENYGAVVRPLLIQDAAFSRGQQLQADTTHTPAVGVAARVHKIAAVAYKTVRHRQACGKGSIRISGQLRFRPEPK